MAQQGSVYFPGDIVVTLLCHIYSPATGETFLPYYTGRAIDGIVIQKSMDKFSTAVVIMALLAIGRYPC